jgi:Ca-activated chloride channel family protein
MRRELIILLLLLTLLSYAGGQKSSKNPKETAAEDDVVRVDTTLVVLPVRVKDRHNKFIAGLTEDQFHIYEDGIEQEIKYFEPASAPNDSSINASLKPLTIALMLDVSDSTQFKLEQIQSTAMAFVDFLRPGDRVMILAFDKVVRVLAEATVDRNVLREAIKNVRAGGGTSLYQALTQTIEKLNRLGGRKVIVMLTDGVDTSSKGVTSDSTIRVAEQSYVSIYPIQYNTYGDFADNPSRETYGAGEFGKTAHISKNGEPASESYKRATLYLRLLADKTSGYFQYADNTKALARSFDRIAAQLRQQYTIGYYPKNKTADARVRQIRVEVGVPEVRVETRKSYVYKPIDN